MPGWTSRCGHERRPWRRLEVGTPMSNNDVELTPKNTYWLYNIYILLYHLYRIWRSNAFSVGLQLYHPISCSSYLHNTFYCFPREKHFAFQSSWQVARHGSFAAVTEQDALTETSARSPGEDKHFGWLVATNSYNFMIHLYIHVWMIHASCMFIYSNFYTIHVFCLWLLYPSTHIDSQGKTLCHFSSISIID